jgi:hypothetical protein
VDEEDRVEDLIAAHDLRRQIQERYAATDEDRPMTAESIPKFMDDHSETLRKVLSSMDNSGRKVDDLLRQLKEGLVQMALPSPRDEPMLHSVVKIHCEDIERVCRSLNLRLRSGIAFGVNPGAGLEVMQHPVPMTEASIVSVSKMFIPFCGIVSKVLARSVAHDLTGELVAVSFAPDGVLGIIRSDPSLHRYWFDLIASFALFGAPTLVRPDVLPFPRSVTRAQLLAAMEVFAIAHEYGHHIANQRIGDVASVRGGNDLTFHSEELEADFLACVICTHVALEQAPQNPYGLWGAGGVLMLKSLELVRRAQVTLRSGSDHVPVSTSHPPIADRIQAMSFFDENAPGSQKGPSTELRRAFEQIFDRIWGLLFPVFLRLHKEGVRPVEAGTEFDDLSSALI